MKRRAFTLVCASLTGIALALPQRPAKANVFGDFAAVVTDPLKLSKFSDKFQAAIQAALIQIDQLEARGAGDAKLLLAQLREIIAFAIEKGETVEAEAFVQLNALETKITADATELIYRAECAGEVLLNDRIQQAIVSATENLAKARPTVTIFGIPLLSFHSKPVKINDPYTTYLETKASVLENLRQSTESTKEKTPAYEVVTTYQNLERLARLVQCHHLDEKANSAYIQQDIANYELLSTPWTQVVFAVHP